MQLKSSFLHLQAIAFTILEREKSTKYSSSLHLFLSITIFTFMFSGVSLKMEAQIINDSPPFVLTVDQLKSWTSNGSTADPKNVSKTPLEKRFIQTHTQINPSLSNAMRVTYAPDGMNNLGNYIDEQDQFNLYNFTHWSYIDNLIWFGGTADQTIQIPSAPWTNTAHKNGVKVYGNVFFAPNYFGGTSVTVSNFLEKNASGKFIAAEKLKDMSTYYKFDGWFINMETNTTNANGQLMREFVEELRNILPEDQDVIWYDAMLPNGNVSWQDKLNTNNSTFLQDGNSRISDGMFINFFWSGSTNPNISRTTAHAINRSEFDVLTGVDLWPSRNQNPFESGGNNWMEALHEENTPITSLALFVPNVIFQNDRYSNFANVDNDIERKRFYDAEKHLFGGSDFNPQSTDSNGFKGLSNWIPASSTITTLPFKTSFNTGHGRLYANNGAQSIKNWHNISNQDVLPTWQFAINGSNEVSAFFDFSTAYNGGTSLAVEGVLKKMEKTTLKLYKTKLAISEKTKVDVTYSLGDIANTNMNLVIAFSEDPTKLIPFRIGRSRSSGWNIKTLDLGRYTGKELALVGFEFTSYRTINDYKINIGELKIFDGPAGDTNLPIANFKADKTNVKVGEQVNFSRNESTSAMFGLWSFPGGTPHRSTKENPIVTYNKIGTYEVSLTVINQTGRVTEIKTDYIVVDNDPVADFIASATDLQIGESVDFTNTSTNDKSWSWSFPGGNPTSSIEENPTVMYNTVGTFDVSLTAINEDGTNTLTKTKHISISDNTAIDHTDPVGIGVITARAEINANESKEKAFDNLYTPSNGTKWLDNAGVPSDSNPSWIQIQLPTAKTVNTLVITSANDAPDRDPEEFRLLGSNNGIDYTLLESWSEQFFSNRYEQKNLPFFNEESYVYYRLEITKNKGDVSLMQIGEIELRGPNQNLTHSNLNIDQSSFKLYPVPSKDIVTLEGDFPKNSKMNILSTIDRRILKSKQINSKRTSILLYGMPPGLYIVTVVNNGKVYATDKISIR